MIEILSTTVDGLTGRGAKMKLPKLQPQLLISVMALALATIGCSGTNTASEQSTTTLAVSLDNLQQIVTDFVGDADGGAVVVMTRGEATLSFAAGRAGAFADDLSKDTPLRVGSISKTFVATMVMQLVDDGLVDVDQPLTTYLPETSIGAETTLRSLLGHTSGIANYTDESRFFEDVLADPERTFSIDEVLGYVAEEPPTDAGSFAYSNTNYILLGQLIEKIDGTSLNDALQTRISGPLGLEATAFVGAGVAPPENLAGGWSQQAGLVGSTASYESIASSAWSAGALVSTATELNIFLRGLFDGELISSESLAEMTDTGDDGYGLGLFVAQLGINNPGYAHNGAIYGYSSTMGISPDSGDVIVILTNNDALIADMLAPVFIQNW